jgi:hypothetical protein
MHFAATFEWACPCSIAKRAERVSGTCQPKSEQKQKHLVNIRSSDFNRCGTECCRRAGFGLEWELELE